jgi:coproporphyrinogen III oxidase-like Fe-S oxidoreductase
VGQPNNQAGRMAKTPLPRYSWVAALSYLPLSRGFSTAPRTVSNWGPSAGVYLHIPFCRRRCHYCDFPIKVIGEKQSARQSSGEAYTNTLLQDIDRWTSANGHKETPVDTVYFGGGTPSLLPDECMCRPCVFAQLIMLTQLAFLAYRYRRNYRHPQAHLYCGPICGNNP